MEITTKRKSLMGTLNYIIILPVFFIGIFMAGISYILIKKNVYYEIRSGMENEAYTLANTYDVMYPGYYELVKAENLMALKKGEHYLTNDFIDNIKEDTGLEITIFYNDIRMITTLYSDNKRITGSKMNSAIKKDVLDNGYSKFYDDVRIEEERFFAYYLPVHNGSENIIGAICILKPANQIHSKFTKQVIPLIAMIIAGVVIITYLNYLYFGKLNKNFKHIRNFLGEVTGGTSSGIVQALLCALSALCCSSRRFSSRSASSRCTKPLSILRSSASVFSACARTLPTSPSSFAARLLSSFVAS